MTLQAVFPAQRSPDLVERLLEARLAWNRDDGLQALTLLNAILDDYPWSQEALQLYGTVAAATRHCFHPIANYRLYEWMAGFQLATDRPSDITDEVERFRLMKEILQGWLVTHRLDAYGISPALTGPDVPQWAHVADIGGADGAMALAWTGLPGTRHCFNFDVSRIHCHQGKQWRSDPRLHFVQSLGDSLPVRSQSFDVAILSGILEHVLSPEAYVTEADRILRPGGLLLIQVPYGGTEEISPPLGFSLPRAFRTHVHSINPLAIYPQGHLLEQHYIRYTNTVQNPHSFCGECGDWVVAYVKVKLGI